MKRNAAFTLVEIIISIAIFVLLVGGIFTAVRTAVVTSAAVAQSQLDSERFTAFQEFLRKLFVSLPGNATVELRLREISGRGDVIELLMAPMDGEMRFGGESDDGVALSALPDGHGRFTVSLGYFSTEETPEERDRRLSEEAWLPLLRDVTKMRWRFADARNPILSETWNEQNGRPGLVELDIETAGGTTATFDYWVPPLQRRGNYYGGSVVTGSDENGGQSESDGEQTEPEVTP